MHYLFNNNRINRKALMKRRKKEEQRNRNKQEWKGPCPGGRKSSSTLFHSIILSHQEMPASRPLVYKLSHNQVSFHLKVPIRQHLEPHSLPMVSSSYGCECACTTHLHLSLGAPLKLPDSGSQLPTSHPHLCVWQTSQTRCFQHSSEFSSLCCSSHRLPRVLTDSSQKLWMIVDTSLSHTL